MRILLFLLLPIFCFAQEDSRDQYALDSMAAHRARLSLLEARDTVIELDYPTYFSDCLGTNPGTDERLPFQNSGGMAYVDYGASTNGYFNGIYNAFGNISGFSGSCTSRSISDYLDTLGTAAQPTELTSRWYGSRTATNTNQFLFGFFNPINDLQPESGIFFLSGDDSDSIRAVIRIDDVVEFEETVGLLDSELDDAYRIWTIRIVNNPGTEDDVYFLIDGVVVATASVIIPNVRMNFGWCLEYDSGDSAAPNIYMDYFWYKKRQSRS